jgi:hypothetical protein
MLLCIHSVENMTNSRSVLIREFKNSRETLTSDSFLDKPRSHESFAFHLFPVGHSSFEAVMPPFPTTSSIVYGELRNIRMKT